MTFIQFTKVAESRKIAIKKEDVILVVEDTKLLDGSDSRVNCVRIQHSGMGSIYVSESIEDVLDLLNGTTVSKTNSVNTEFHIGARADMKHMTEGLEQQLRTNPDFKQYVEKGENKL